MREGVQPFGVVARGSGVGIPDGEIYTKHKDDLIRYATALVGPSDAEDLVATVVLRVLQRGRLSDLVQPRPYLFRAVLNEARGVMRNRARPSGTAELVEAAVGVDRDVLDAVLRLPVRQRAVVYLIYWETDTPRSPDLDRECFDADAAQSDTSLSSKSYGIGHQGLSMGSLKDTDQITGYAPFGMETSPQAAAGPGGRTGCRLLRGTFGEVGSGTEVETSTSHWSMRSRLLIAGVAFLAVAAACSSSDDSTTGSSTSTAPTVEATPQPTSDPTVGATTVPAPGSSEQGPAAVPDAVPEPATMVFPATPWPDPEGDPPWITVPVGLPGTTHLRIGQGPLGFISVNNVERGAVVRLSADGAVWQETATLRGPDGEKQVAVTDLVVSGDEYLVVGETWTNTATGSESFRDALWRSRDGMSWTVIDLGVIDDDAKGTAAIPTPLGLVLAGTIYDEATGAASPKLWIETADALWSDLTADVSAFDVAGWMTGAAIDTDGLIAWGTTSDGVALVWRTPDLQTWTRATLPDTTNGHVVAVTAFRGGYVAVGQSQTWVSDDAVEWTIAATANDFATDAVSPGQATFRRLYVQDGYLVAVAGVGYHTGAAWCYLDPADCRQFPQTVLTSGDAREWRRLPLPGELDQPEHPIEVDAVLADGRLTVLHTVGGDAVMSTLTEVGNVQRLDTAEAPDLLFTVAEPGDEIDIGIKYGYPIYTHCGFPTIGPLNGTNWAATEHIEATGEAVAGWGLTVYGFIELTAEDQLDYIVGDQVIARYRPDPQARAFCG